MNPNARSALTLAVLLVLPQLQALCPRLAPDVISGKVIPCRYLCIKINFLELPSIILSTERDGVLCSTLLLRRRGVCRNGGCIPFGSDDEIKPKGALGKVIAAIDKFASGSYRQKAPTPGTPFGPIVSTATSLFGGGSSTTSGSTSNTASSIVATATAAAVGSTFKNLFSGSTSGSSDNSRRNERPALNPFSDSLLSNPKPGHQANSAGGTLPSSSSAVAVNFGGGPPVLPLSTDGGAETEGTQASPGTPLINSRSHSGHPALAPFPSPPPPERKGPINPGSASDASNSNGNVIKTAIGLVLGNLRGISASSTSGIPSRQPPSGGPVEGLKRSFDSPVPTAPKSPSVLQNGLKKEITGGSGATPTAFQLGGDPLIVPPSSSSGAESNGNEKLRRLAASPNQFQPNPALTAPAAPAVTNAEFKPAFPAIKPSHSKSPSIQSGASGAASRAGRPVGSQLTGAFRAALTSLRVTSPGATRNALPDQPSLAALDETPKPSTSSIIQGQLNAGPTPITAGYGSGGEKNLHLTGVVAEREHQDTSQRPGASKTVLRPLNGAAEAVELPTVPVRGPSQLLTSNPALAKSAITETAHLERPPPSRPDSFSGSPIKKLLDKALNPLRRVPTEAIPTTSTIPPSSAVQDESLKPSNNSPTKLLRAPDHRAEVNPTKNIAAGSLQNNPTPGAVEFSAGKRTTPPSTAEAAENEYAGASPPSTAPNLVLQPAVTAETTPGASLTSLQGPPQMSTNKPANRPSAVIRRAGLQFSAALRPTNAVRNRMEKTFRGAFNPLKQVFGSPTPIMSIKKKSSAVPDNTSEPRGGPPIRNLHNGANGPELKSTDETNVRVLQGYPTHAAVVLGGGTPSIPPSPMKAAENDTAKPSRLSAATSTLLRTAPNVAKTDEASITNEQGPSQIPASKPSNRPSLPTGSLELQSAAVSQATTSARSRMKGGYKGLLNTFKQVSSTPTPTDRFRQTTEAAADETPITSNSSIQGIHEGASSPKAKHNKETAAAGLPGSSTPINVQLSSGTKQVPPSTIGAEKTMKTSSTSTAQNSGLLRGNVESEITKAGFTNIENSSQVSANKPVNRSSSSMENSALKSPPASGSSGLTKIQMEKTFDGALNALRRISKGSTPFMPKKKTTLVALNEKIQPISPFNKGVNSPKKPHVSVEKKRPLTTSPATIPATIGDHARIAQASTKKGASGSPEASEQPAAPALKPGNAVAKNAMESAGEPSGSGSDLRNLRPSANIMSGILRSPKLKRPEHPSGSQFTHNHSRTESAASLSKDFDSTKQKVGTLASDGVQSTTLSTMSKAVARATPTELSVSSHGSNRPSSSTGSNSRTIKSADVDTSITDKKIPSALTNIASKPLSQVKRQKKPTGTHNESRTPEKDVAGAESPSFGAATAKGFDGLNSFSTTKYQSNFSSKMSSQSELGLASASTASSPSPPRNAQINARLENGIVQGSKESLALVHPTKNKIATIPLSDNVTANLNPNNVTELGRVNQSYAHSPSTGTASAKGTPANIVSSVSEVPTTHGSTPAPVTGTKNAPSGTPSTTHGGTVVTPLKSIIASSGSAPEAKMDNQLVPKPVTAAASQSVVVTSVSKSSNLAGRRNMDTDTSSISGERNNRPSARESNDVKNSTLSQMLSSSNGRYERKISSGTDTSSTAEPASTAKEMNGTSSSASKKRDSSLTSPPPLIPTTTTTISSPLSVPSASSVPGVHASSPLANTLKDAGKSEKHEPMSGSFSTINRSISLGRAEERIQNPRPSPGTPAGTKENVGKPSTTGPPARLISSAALRVAAQNLEGQARPAVDLENTTAHLKPTSTSGPSSGIETGSAKSLERPVAAPSSVPRSSLHAATHAQNRASHGATSGLISSVPSTPAAQESRTRNPSTGALKHETTKTGNIPAFGSPSDLSAKRPKSSAPANVQASKLSAPTPAGNIGHSESADTPKVSAGSARMNGETSRALAGTLAKMTTQIRKIATANSFSGGKKILSLERVSPNMTLKPSGKSLAKTNSRLGSRLSLLSDAFRLRARSESATTNKSTKPSEGVSTSPLPHERNETSPSSISPPNADVPTEPAVPNPKSKASADKTENAVNKVGPTAGELLPPTVSEKPSSQPTNEAPEATVATPTTHPEQPAAPLYTGSQPFSGIVFGRPPSMPNGFWGPARSLPGMFRPF